MDQCFISIQWNLLRKDFWGCCHCMFSLSFFCGSLWVWLGEKDQCFTNLNNSMDVKIPGWHIYLWSIISTHMDNLITALNHRGILLMTFGLCVFVFFWLLCIWKIKNAFINGSFCYRFWQRQFKLFKFQQLIFLQVSWKEMIITGLNIIECLNHVFIAG